MSDIPAQVQAQRNVAQQKIEEAFSLVMQVQLQIPFTAEAHGACNRLRELINPEQFRTMCTGDLIGLINHIVYASVWEELAACTRQVTTAQNFQRFSKGLVEPQAAAERQHRPAQSFANSLVETQAAAEQSVSIAPPHPTQASAERQHRPTQSFAHTLSRIFQKLLDIVPRDRQSVSIAPPSPSPIL